MAASPLIGPDVGGQALGRGDAVEVGHRHAGGHGGGRGGGARIDRHRATLEMVIPAHIPGVVHKESAELGTRERYGARLDAADEGEVPARVVVNDVVVVDVVAADRGPLLNAISGTIHHDVVVHGGGIVRRDGPVGGDLNAISPAVGHH